jgi:hypothetical protein
MTLEIQAETPLERRLLADRRLRAGLRWGAPRAGHPEGSIANHVAAMLARIAPGDPLREDLRLLAILHDAFKAEVRPDERWSPENDHATRARRFAENYLGDERLLATLELHDEPYWIWRHAGTPEHALGPLLERLPDIELFARFVELDAAGEGKDLTFLWWFRRELALAGRLSRHERTDAAIPPLNDRELVYAKAFATEPPQQPAIAHAAEALVADLEAAMPGRAEVLASDDGLRVWLLWRWHGSRDELIERDAGVVASALTAHPEFAEARALEARVFRVSQGS